MLLLTAVGYIPSLTANDWHSESLMILLSKKGICVRLCGLDSNASDILRGAWFDVVISQTELLRGSSHCLQVVARVVPIIIP
jgi:hypothetical protein